MKELSLLEGGCPCTKPDCPNHGNCPECIKRHYRLTDEIVFCMRKKGERIYSGKAKEKK